MKRLDPHKFVTDWCQCVWNGPESSLAACLVCRCTRK